MTLTAPPFTLAAALGPKGLGTPESGVLLVVIEGDGRAYETRQRPSPDPTPRHPRGVELARFLADHHRPVAYLARPCQWSPGDLISVCSADDWTTGRFSPRIIAAAATAIETLRRRASARSVVLVGYSGGAQLATMIAATTGTVTGLGSLSGVLDHAAWTQHHGVSALAGSRAPSPPPDLPQIHIIGTADDIAPLHLLSTWADTAQGRSQVTVLAVQGMDHDDPIPAKQAIALLTLVAP